MLFICRPPERLSDDRFRLQYSYDCWFNVSCGVTYCRWGRRTALVVCGSGAGVLGLAKSFANSYHTYLLGELLETVLGASVYPSAFVLSE